MDRADRTARKRPDAAEGSREPPMKVRDSDLRQAVHSHGAHPGSDLWQLLRELQERRDRANILGNGGR